MAGTDSAQPLVESRNMEPVPRTVPLAVVIASAPGIAEQSLRATLEALPSVHVVGSAAGCLSALQLVRDRQAGLVVIDSNVLIEDVEVFLKLLKREGLGTRSLVLAATSSQMRRALQAGADVVVDRDISIRQLGAAVAAFERSGTLGQESTP
jgi:DNA-binding NarL/FixJ family response regulator